jgi:hypothetical protein
VALEPPSCPGDFPLGYLSFSLTGGNVFPPLYIPLLPSGIVLTIPSPLVTIAIAEQL